MNVDFSHIDSQRVLETEHTEMKSQMTVSQMGKSENVIHNQDTL